jgi:hypothetical protein
VLPTEDGVCASVDCVVVGMINCDLAALSSPIGAIERTPMSFSTVPAAMPRASSSRRRSSSRWRRFRRRIPSVSFRRVACAVAGKSAQPTCSTRHSHGPSSLVTSKAMCTSRHSPPRQLLPQRNADRRERDAALPPRGLPAIELGDDSIDQERASAIWILDISTMTAPSHVRRLGNGPPATPRALPHTPGIEAVTARARL